MPKLSDVALVLSVLSVLFTFFRIWDKRNMGLALMAAFFSILTTVSYLILAASGADLFYLAFAIIWGFFSWMDVKSANKILLE